MKKLFLLIIILASVVGLQAQTINQYSPKPGPTPVIKLKEPVKFTLPNGLKVFVIEDHKIPKISLALSLDYQVPLLKNKVGLTSFLGNLGTSGTTSRSDEQIRQLIDNTGSDFQVSQEGIYCSALSRHFPKIFDLFADILLHSKFSQKAFDIAKSNMIDGMEMAKDNPETQVGNTMAFVSFGANHAYGEVPSDETLKNITLDDCQKYFNKYFNPSVGYLAIVGDITVAEAKKLVMAKLSGWKKLALPKVEYKTNPNPVGRQVYLVDKSDAVQSSIKVGGVKSFNYNSPDYLAGRLANHLLGGGASSKLFLDLREKHGWTYGSYSSFNPDRFGAMFEASAQVRNIVTDSSIVALLQNIANMQVEKISDTSLTSAKNFLKGNFSRSLEDPQNIASYAIRKEMYGLPANFYANYLKNLDAITAQDIMQASKKYFDANNINIVVSGKKSEILDKLKALDSDGNVEIRNYLGQPVAEQKATALNITAEKIIANYIAAIGGEEKLNSIKSLKSEYTFTVQGMNLKMKMFYKDNIKFANSAEMNGTVMNKEVFDGTKGYAVQMGQRSDFDEEKIKEQKSSALMFEQANFLKPEYKLTLLGKKTVNNKETYEIEVKKPNGASELDYFDTTDFLIVQTIISKKQEGIGEFSMKTTVEEYKTFDNGIKLPAKLKTQVGPQSFNMTLDKLEFNTDIPDSTFE